MKKQFFGMLLLLAGFTNIALSQSGAGKISLSGQLKNFTNQVEVEDLSEYQYLLPSGTSAQRVFVPDSAGNFSVVFTAKAPNYYRLGRNILYLSPNDKLEVFIDRNDPRIARFSGKGAEPNLYLRNTPFPKSGSFVNWGRPVLDRDPLVTLAGIREAGAYRARQLDSARDLSAEFRRLETARIKADIINSMNTGAIYSTMKFGLKGDSAKDFTTKYKAVLQPTIDEYANDFIDPSLLKIVVYRDVLDDVLKHPGAEKDKVILKEWLASSQLTEDIRKESDKKRLKAYAPKISAIKTKGFQDALNQSLASLLKFAKGDQAKDFVAYDAAGQPVKLSSLKGQTIYLDLWATWCGPCLAEMPHFEKLKEKYKENKEIAFVSLSIDDSKTLWKKDMNARKADGLQWLINRNALSDYEIVSIPRTIIIDKDFKVVDLNAPVPSSPKTIELINELIK